ncbi:MAG: S-layer homology domain-containing protein, partial [Synergistaceae bacterium]|nr:S-layer homology domain-containing protein [Synergistaceae bacterium]
MKKLIIAVTAVVLAAVAAPAFAAMNPFMDVPASHWAYDAVAQLASRGIVSGYPDGTFKGPQPATR